MKTVLTLTFLLFCTLTFAQSDVKTKILDTIVGLPEVKKLADQIETLSNKQRHIKIFIYSEPTKTKKYYWVKVAEDNGTNLVSYYNFFVYPQTYVIKYFDTVKDKVLNLDTWRKTFKK